MLYCDNFWHTDEHENISSPARFDKICSL